MRTVRLLPLVLIATFLMAGCDSSEDAASIDEAYLAGSWYLSGVQDGSGDRTADVGDVVTMLRLEFAGGTFDAHIEYEPATGLEPITLQGDYSISSADQLILTIDGVAVSFGATAVSQNTLELRAPAIVVSQILDASNLDLSFSGTVTLTMSRGSQSR